MTHRLARALACLAACLALPAGAQAASPGFTPVGPPEGLHAFAFGLDGTIYGTIGSQFSDDANVGAALWRSGDHGRIWSAVYRPVPGAELAVLGVSPADSRSAVVSVLTGVYSAAIDRVDAVSGRAVPLPFEHFQGIDAAGTIYGFSSLETQPGVAVYSLVRCPRASDTCSKVPATADAFHAVVDPLSVGVLAMTSAAGGVSQVSVSSDGGATWAPGAAVPGSCSCPLAFAGPAPRSLYVISTTALSASHDAGLTWTSNLPVPAGNGPIVGSAPAVALSQYENKPYLPVLSFTSDDGASYRTVPMREPGSVIGVDPIDTAHLFLEQAGSRTVQSRDSGATSSELADPRFGLQRLLTGSTDGAGRDIYAVAGDAIWSSDDLGATWTQTRLPFGSRPGHLLVSRDDPRSAYVTTQPPSGAVELRTRDGGRTWVPLTGELPPRISAIVPGSPDHVLADGNESLDGGVTWTPFAAACSLAAIDDARSPTGKRIVCAQYVGAGEIGATYPVSASPYGVFGAPGTPGMLAVASGTLLGDVGPGGAFAPLLAPTDIFGPGAPPDGAAQAAWPAAGGSTFAAIDQRTGVTWMRRGSGRWWRLQQSGIGLSLVSLLDATHALVVSTNWRSPLPNQGGAQLSVLDLAQPAVDPPHIEKQPGGLTCVVPWSRADADTTAYAWLRDGVVLHNATRLQYQSTALDRGHDLACRATATTSWGSVAVTSTLAYTVAGARVSPPRPHLTGAPLVGSRLTCSARRAVTWLRAGRAVPGPHARTYRVRPLDRGVAIACRTQLPDGTVVVSPSARITGGGSS